MKSYVDKYSQIVNYSPSCAITSLLVLDFVNNRKIWADVSDSEKWYCVLRATDVC